MAAPAFTSFTPKKIILENGAGSTAPLNIGHASLAQTATEVFEGAFLTGTEILAGPTG